MPRELTDILDDIDRRVREGLSVKDEKLCRQPRPARVRLHPSDSIDDERLWCYVGIVADLIPLLLEYRREHEPCSHYEAELHKGRQRVNAIFPQCAVCQKPISWRRNSSLLLGPHVHLLRLCRICTEAGFRLSQFGECPTCHRNDGCRSIGPDHWYYCDTHRAKWCIGSNLFSCWKHMTEEDWRHNAEHLANFHEVEPSFWMSPDQALLETDGDDPGDPPF
jgi:hypothetical protein